MKEYEELRKYLQRGNFTKEEKTAIIKEFGKLYEQKINKEYTDYRNKQITAGALEIGSAAIPAVGIGGSAVKAGAGKALQKTLGRRLSQKVTESAIDGAASGAVFGTGRGLAENQNPLFTAATDATLGGLYSGAIGGTIAKPAIDAHIKETRTINDLRKHWGIPFRKASGDAQKAIDTLLENKQGFVPNAFSKEGIGNVDMVWGNSKLGLQHIIERRNSQNINGVDFVKNLPDLIKNGTIYNKQGHVDRQYIGNLEQEIAIKNNYQTPEKNIDRNWVPSAYEKIYQNKKAQALLGLQAKEKNYLDKQRNPLSNLEKLFNPQATHVRLTSESSYPDKQTSFIRLEDINNINEISKKYNLDKWLYNNSSIPLNIHYNKDGEARIETGIKYNDYATNSQPFTREDIKNMTLEEFNKNEQLIMQQAKQGEIKSKAQQKNFSNYINSQSGDNRILTREDIANMTLDQYIEKEKEIQTQYNTIGIPTNQDMQAAVQSGGAVYIAPYTRSDGTQVKGYYRAR